MILNDEVPIVWETVQRLQALGLDRSRIWVQLDMSLITTLQQSIGDMTGGRFEARLTDQLVQLPLPAFDDIEMTIRRIIGKRADLGLDDLSEAVRHELGSARAMRRTPSTKMSLVNCSKPTC